MLWFGSKTALKRWGGAAERAKIPVLRRANAQAKAGLLMLMVRRANMGLSIAGGRENRKGGSFKPIFIVGGRMDSIERPDRSLLRLYRAGHQIFGAGPLWIVERLVADSCKDTNLLIIGEKLMTPKTRAQVYEDLKDLRRRGELQQVGKAALEKLPAAAQKELKKNGVFLIPGFAKFVVVRKPAAKSGKRTNLAAGGEMMFEAKPVRKGVHRRPVSASSQRQELFRVLEIEALADRVFGDERKAKAWLSRPNASMSGQIPLELMKDELGAAVVREALEQIDQGIFA